MNGFMLFSQNFCTNPHPAGMVDAELGSLFKVICKCASPYIDKTRR
jgi:hypothetical protein